MIDIRALIENIKSLQHHSPELRSATGDGPTAMRTDIIAALIVHDAIHKSTIQTFHLYSAIQDLTAALIEFTQKLPPQPGG